VAKSLSQLIKLFSMAKVYLILLLISFTTVQAQQYEWLQGFQATDRFSVTIDKEGNSYTLITFEDSITEHDYDWRFDSLHYTIIKRDRNNNLLWSKTIFCDSTSIFFTITFNRYNEAILNGSFSKNLITPNFTLTSNGDLDIVILKIDANGNFSLVRQIGGPDHEQGFCAFDGNDNIVVAGGYRGTANIGPLTFTSDTCSYLDFFIVSFDPAWNVLWSDHAPIVNYTCHYDFCWSSGISIDNQNNIYVQIDGGGILQSNGMAVGNGEAYKVYKFNNAGNYLITYDVEDNLFSQPAGYYFDQASNIYYALREHSQHTSAVSKIVKKDQYDTVIWSNQYGDYFAPLDYNIDGFYCNDLNFYASGFSDTTINGTREFLSIGDLQTGNILLTYHDNLDATYIAEDQYGALYLAGRFRGTKTLGSHTITSLYPDRFSPFIVKLSPQSTDVTHISNQDFSFQIFPNPTTSTFTLTCPQSSINSPLKIYNTYGAIIHESVINSQSSIIVLSAQPKGVYFLEVGNTVKKITLIN
jgi:hypothetical protein